MNQPELHQGIHPPTLSSPPINMIPDALFVGPIPSIAPFVVEGSGGLLGGFLALIVEGIDGLEDINARSLGPGG